MKNKIFFIALFFSFVIPYCYAKQSLIQLLEEYVHSYPETVSVPLDWQYPNFKEFFYTRKKTFFSNILQSIRLQKKDPWLEQSFIDQCKQITRQYKKRYAGQEVYFFENYADKKILLWGPLHGAFHSLVKTLRYLIKQEILNEDLILQKEDIHFVFMGDLTDRSAYPLETLYVVSLLAFFNKNNVHLLQGKSEYKSRWKYETLGDQLFALERKDLCSVFEELFATLPRLFAITDKKSKGAVLVGALDVLNEKKIMNQFHVFDYRAFIYNEGLFHTQGMKLTGLDQMNGDDNSTNWIITSSATQVFKKYYNFDEDAYAEIACKDQLQNSTIRSVRAQPNAPEFITHPWRNIFTGIEIGKLQDTLKPFFVGSTLGLTQGIISMSQNAKLGMSQAFMRANDELTLGEYYMMLSIIDDQYRTAQALQNVNYFIQRGIDSLLLPTGSPTLQHYT